MIVSIVAKTILSCLKRDIEIMQEFKSALLRYDTKTDPDLLDIIKNMEVSFSRTSELMVEEFIEELSVGTIDNNTAKEIFTLMVQERNLMLDIMKTYHKEMSAQRNKLIHEINLLNDIKEDILAA